MASNSKLNILGNLIPGYGTKNVFGPDDLPLSRKLSDKSGHSADGLLDDSFFLSSSGTGLKKNFRKSPSTIVGKRIICFSDINRDITIEDYNFNFTESSSESNILQQSKDIVGVDSSVTEVLFSGFDDVSDLLVVDDECAVENQEEHNEHSSHRNPAKESKRNRPCFNYGRQLRKKDGVSSKTFFKIKNGEVFKKNIFVPVSGEKFISRLDIQRNIRIRQARKISLTQRFCFC